MTFMSEPPPVRIMRNRGRILTSQALNRIGQAIEKKFPSSEFPEIYERTPYKYNLSQLAQAMDFGDQGPIDSETLRKILQRDEEDPGVDVRSLKKLFQFFEEPLDPKDYHHPSRCSEGDDVSLDESGCLPRRLHSRHVGREEQIKQLLN